MSILNTASLGVLNAQVDTTSITNTSTIGVVITGTWVGTLTFQGSVDGTNFFNMNVLPVATNVFASTTTANGTFLVNCAGIQAIRVKMTAYTSGSATVEAYSSNSPAFINTVATLAGATDGTRIGNIADRLKVDPNVTGSKARILDMNAANGGVARGTGIASTSVYTTLFNYSGSGNIFNFLIQFEGNLVGADSFNIKFEIDNVIVFEISTSDVGTGALYGLSTDGDENTMGLSLNSNVFRFAVPRGLGLTYLSNAKVSIKKETSASSKQFRAGMIFLTKDT